MTESSEPQVPKGDQAPIPGEGLTAAFIEQQTGYRLVPNISLKLSAPGTVGYHVGELARILETKPEDDGTIFSSLYQDEEDGQLYFGFFVDPEIDATDVDF